MKDSEKIAFGSYMSQFLTDNKDTLLAEGFDSSIVQASLDEKVAAAIAKEDEQATAFANYKMVTTESQATTAKAYEIASRIVDSVSGALGKDHPLVKEIRKRRK